MPSQNPQEAEVVAQLMQLPPGLRERAYQAYLNEHRTSDESGGQSYNGDGRMLDKAWFDKLPMREQLNLLGGLTLTSKDEGYDDFKSRLGGESGRNIWLTADRMGASKPGDAEGFLNDPSQELAGDGFFAHSEDNQTPTFQRKGHEKTSYGRFAAMLAAIYGGAMGAEALGGAAAGGEGVGAAAGAGEGAGGLTFQNTGLSSLFQGAPTAVPGAATEGLGAAGAATGGSSSGGGLASLGQTGGAPITDLSVPAGGASSGSGGVMQQAGNWLSNNPGQAVKLGMGLASLGAGASGGSSGSGGGNSDAGSIIDQMAAANRVDQNTPIGSRKWAQDPATGRWTVNDTMSAPEQANFTNVQGLNSGITDMAKQYLARILSQPQRPSAAAPISIGGRMIGG